MAEKFGIDFDVKGLDALNHQISAWNKQNKLRFLDGVGHRMSHLITEKSPKGHIPFTSKRVQENVVLITSPHPGAKALDKGAYIKAKGGKKLHFVVDGKQVFVTYVRLKARKYTNKAMRQRRTVIQEEYNRTFGAPKEFK